MPDPAVSPAGKPENSAHDFERVYVGKMRLAVEVLLDCADDLSDGLQVELHALKDKLDHGLLQDALNTRP